MSVPSINEPDASRTWMVLPASINEPPHLPAPPVAPQLASLSPANAVIGDPSFTLTITGSGFVDGQSVIVFAGNDEPTTFVDDTSLTTGVNMAVWLGPDVLPVQVRNFNQVSNTLDFTFTATREAAPAPERDDDKPTHANHHTRRKR
jgi:hypothetical protein